MTENNPYQAPTASLNDADPSDILIERVASGQKLIIYAIVINILATVLQLAIHPILGLLGLVSLVMAVIGVIKLTAGLSASVISKVIYVILMFVPVINLITLLILNSRATRELRAKGYKVGLMGASKPTDSGEG